MRLTQIPRPFLVAVITDPDPDAIAAEVDLAARGGAGAIELNLAQVAESDLCRVRRIAEASRAPLYTSCRRAEFMRVYGIETPLPPLADAERMERQLRFNGAACALDMEFDAFASVGRPLDGMPPGCREIASSKESIERQREVVVAAHASGSDVILSCHTGVPLSAPEALRLAECMRSRGADAVKIVERHEDAAHPGELWKTAALLRSVSQSPFVLLSTGPGDTLWRRIACHAGCSWTFVRPPGARYFYPGHPPLEDMIALRKALPPAEVA